MSIPTRAKVYFEIKLLVPHTYKFSFPTVQASDQPLWAGQVATTQLFWQPVTKPGNTRSTAISHFVRKAFKIAILMRFCSIFFLAFVSFLLQQDRSVQSQARSHRRIPIRLSTWLNPILGALKRPALEAHCFADYQKDLETISRTTSKRFIDDNHKSNEKSLWP